MSYTLLLILLFYESSCRYWRRTDMLFSRSINPKKKKKKNSIQRKILCTKKTELNSWSEKRAFVDTQNSNSCHHRHYDSRGDGHDVDDGKTVSPPRPYKVDGHTKAQTRARSIISITP